MKRIIFAIKYIDCTVFNELYDSITFDYWDHDRQISSNDAVTSCNAMHESPIA